MQMFKAGLDGLVQLLKEARKGLQALVLDLLISSLNELPDFRLNRTD